MWTWWHHLSGISFTTTPRKWCSNGAREMTVNATLNGSRHCCISGWRSCSHMRRQGHVCGVQVMQLHYATTVVSIWTFFTPVFNSRSRPLPFPQILVWLVRGEALCARFDNKQKQRNMVTSMNDAKFRYCTQKCRFNIKFDFREISKIADA